jgi:hypothetical protein
MPPELEPLPMLPELEPLPMLPELLVPPELEPELGKAPGPEVAGVPGVPLEPGSFTV